MKEESSTNNRLSILDLFPIWTPEEGGLDYDYSVDILESLIKKEKFLEFESALSEFAQEYVLDETRLPVLLVNRLVFKRNMGESDFTEEDCAHLLQLCLRAGEDVNIIIDDNTGKTLLLLVIENKLEKIFDILISQPNLQLSKITIDDEDSDDEDLDIIDLNELSFAAIYGYDQIFKKLYNKFYLELGGELSEKELYRLLDCAIIANSSEIVSFILINNNTNLDNKFVLEEMRVNSSCIGYAVENIRMDCKALKKGITKSGKKIQNLITQDPVIKSKYQKLHERFDIIKANHAKKLDVLENLCKMLLCDPNYLDEMNNLTTIIGEIESQNFATESNKTKCIIL
jgi:hypothetical protein